MWIWGSPVRSRPPVPFFSVAAEAIPKLVVEARQEVRKDAPHNLEAEMIAVHKRVESALCSMVLLSVCLVGSCKTTTSDPRADLLQSLKGANVEGYRFSTREDDLQATATLTNGAVRDLVTLDQRDTNLVLAYTSVRDKKTGATNLYRTEIIKAGSALTLLVTNLTTNEVLERTTSAAPERHNPPAGAPGFNTLSDCIRDFDCTRRGALQCEADRTCQAQMAALICCLNNGQCFSVHLIIRPGSRRCFLGGLIPDLEGMVLTQ